MYKPRSHRPLLLPVFHLCDSLCLIPHVYPDSVSLHRGSHNNAVHPVILVSPNEIAFARSVLTPFVIPNVCILANIQLLERVQKVRVHIAWL